VSQRTIPVSSEPACPVDDPGFTRSWLHDWPFVIVARRPVTLLGPVHAVKLMPRSSPCRSQVQKQAPPVIVVGPFEDDRFDDRLLQVEALVTARRYVRALLAIIRR
jgi:hypothetical protein